MPLNAPRDLVTFSDRKFVSLVSGMKNRFLQVLAFSSFPRQVTIYLHRMRGVHIGKDCFIGRLVYIDDACP
jgi:hypothetical protein